MLAKVFLSGVVRKVAEKGGVLTLAKARILDH